MISFPTVATLLVGTPLRDRHLPSRRCSCDEASAEGARVTSGSLTTLRGACSDNCPRFFVNEESVFSVSPTIPEVTLKSVDSAIERSSDVDGLTEVSFNFLSLDIFLCVCDNFLTYFLDEAVLVSSMSDGSTSVALSLLRSTSLKLSVLTDTVDFLLSSSSLL